MPISEEKKGAENEINENLPWADLITFCELALSVLWAELQG